MNPLKAKNLVAKIIQIYACLNAVSGLILAFILSDTFGSVVSVITCFACLVVSFAIYALGEIIELLNQIKINTACPSTSHIEELPEI